MTDRTIDDDAIDALLYDVASAAYRAARYRGQFRADDLESTQEKLVKRHVSQWWEQDKHQYVDNE